MRFLEVSHKIEPGMKTHPGLPEPRAEVLVDYEASRERYADGTEFYLASLHLCGNTGTYVDACEALLNAGTAFVGIDSVIIDALADLSRPAHTILLGAGVPVCDHMTNLAEVRDGYLHAVPIAWCGGATFPVRAYVMS